jgi:eukaryotic-like serine/threonine-protein kinase
MDQQRWQQIKVLLDSAVELTPERRSSFLAEACGNDQSLRAEIEGLLMHYEQAEDFLEGNPGTELYARIQSRTDEPAFSSGQIISGRFRIVDLIGRGGMGEVYKAEDMRLHRIVALKFLPDDTARHSHALERFQLEAQAASALNHPNICTVYDISEESGRAFIAMEFLDGRSLRDLIAGHRLPIDRVLEISIDIAGALDAAHAKGIIHRDIKPDNIFINDRGDVKILDFGLAKLLRGGSSPQDATASEHIELTQHGAALGTVAYMSPEQARGETLDVRTDLFSFGLVIYEMATGQPAFSGSTSAIIFASLLNDTPRRPSEINPEVPASLEQIISNALEKDRAVRYQRASDIRSDLQRVMRNTPSNGFASLLSEKDKTLWTKEAALPPPKPKRWQYAAAVALILAIAAGALYWFLRPRTPVVTAIHQLTHTGRPKSNYVETDGIRVYFTEFKNNSKSHVAEVSTAGGEVSYVDTQLDDAGVQDISQDGTELLVFGAGTPGSLWILPLPAGPPRRIRGEFTGSSFLPGTSQIVYVLPSDFLHVYAADVDGGNAHSLLQLPRDPGTASVYFIFSPDGSTIRYNTADGKIWESRIDGTGKHLLSDAFRDPSCPDWTAGKKLYVFSSTSEGVSNVWAISQSGWLRSRWPQPVQLTFGPVSFECAVGGKDGKQIYALGRTRRGELSTYDAQAGTFRKYLNGISAGSTDFSPDGQWVAYVTHPQGTLWRSRIDGRERRQLTFSPMGPVLVPKWSPDGRFLAFMEWGSQRKIYLVSADGGAPMLLLSGDFQPADPNWSPDGKFLVYAGESAGEASLMSSNPKERRRSEIRILDLSTKESKSVPGSQGMFSPRWSPDGNYLVAVSDDQKQLLLYSFASQHWQPLALPKLPDGYPVGSPYWSHDSRYIYFESAPDKIFKLKIPGGQPELVVSVAGIDAVYPAMPWGGWFGLTPDEHILMMLDRSVDEIYALDVEYR